MWRRSGTDHAEVDGSPTCPGAPIAQIRRARDSRAVGRSVTRSTPRRCRPTDRRSRRVGPLSMRPLLPGRRFRTALIDAQPTMKPVDQGTQYPADGLSMHRRQNWHTWIALLFACAVACPGAVAARVGAPRSTAVRCVKPATAKRRNPRPAKAKSTVCRPRSMPPRSRRSRSEKAAKKPPRSRAGEEEGQEDQEPAKKKKATKAARSPLRPRHRERAQASTPSPGRWNVLSTRSIQVSRRCPWGTDQTAPAVARVSGHTARVDDAQRARDQLQRRCDGRSGLGPVPRPVGFKRARSRSLGCDVLQRSSQLADPASWDTVLEALKSSGSGAHPAQRQPTAHQDRAGRSPDKSPSASAGATTVQVSPATAQQIFPDSPASRPTGTAALFIATLSPLGTW